MLILSNEDIEKILPVGACLEVLEEAYRDLGNGMAATVPRYDVFSPTKPGEFYEYKTMSGVLPARNVAALRLNSSVVKWYEKAGGIRKDKLPVAGGDKFVGLVMLFSTETGEPLAIFPDGYVQKLRVAGASAIAARYLARKDATIMALLGAGWQASAHLVTPDTGVAAAVSRKLVRKGCRAANRVRQCKGSDRDGRYGDLYHQLDFAAVRRRDLVAGHACFLRQAVRARRGDLSARRSIDHSLARGETISDRDRRRAPVHPRCRRRLAASSHARGLRDLELPNSFPAGEQTASGTNEPTGDQLFLQ
jgi:hypothetical protein